MAQIFSTCSNCGAPTESAVDGRTVACQYCGSHDRIAIDPAKMAASIRADLSALGDFLEHLAGTLETGFPEKTVVERSGWVFSKKKIESLEVFLEDSVFRLHRSRGSLRAVHGASVRGIVVKSDEVPLEDWIERLCASLASLSDSSAAARQAIGKIASKSAR